MNMTDKKFDDGFDYHIKDKNTGEVLAKFEGQDGVLPFAYRIGRDTVTIEKKEREGKKKMSENRIVNLSEMMLKVVSEDVLLPQTDNPAKEAEDLTKDTGLYHYADHDDMIDKPVIVNTNVEATNESEWLEKAFNSPVNEETPVIEPSNFEKNDEYNVSSVDKVAEDEEAGKPTYKAYFNMKSGWYELKNADTGEVVEPRLALDVQDAIKKAAAYNKDGAVTEGYDRDAWEAGYEAFENGQECPSDPSGKDGWMEAKKEHRKAGQMDESEEAPESDWDEKAIGLFKHKFLPLAYDDNSGEVVLYDIDGAGSLDDAEVVGTFDNAQEMQTWIANNLKEGVADHYRGLVENDQDYDEEVADMATDESNKKLDEASETSNIVTAQRGVVRGDDGNNYGPAPTQDQNEMKFDKDGKFVIEAESMDNFVAVAKKARDDSKNGYVQHVDAYGDGNYGVSDWMSDDTVVSYSNGRCINGEDPLEGIVDDTQEEPAGDFDVDVDVNFDENLDEARFKPKGSSFDSYIDTPEFDDVEVTVEYDLEPAEPDVGYAGGITITSVVNKSTGDEVVDSLPQAVLDRLAQEAEEDASGQADDYGDYMYDRMRDERLMDEGKDHRFDPDADDSDYDRQSRFKQRRQDKDAKRNLDEADGSPARVFMLSVDFTPERLEIEHKGMSDTDAALALIADGRPIASVANELNMAGLPLSAELRRDNAYTVIVLASTLREAIDSMLEVPLCQELLNELEIEEDVFYGFLIQGKTSDVLDNATELQEDEEEMFEAPEFVVSSENLNSEELAQDPMFVQVMNDAFLEVAEKLGQKIEDFHPSLDDVDEVIAIGIDNYPNGHKYSFMMSDPMARDAINEAFNILWDAGKINPESVA